jgi:DNA-binding SARP family transcriptional activator
MLRLLTLGGLAIVDDAGNAVGPAASQRRLLALLSVIATARPTGVSRDKLAALFWPDADSERGRHALTQLLYTARRGVQCDDLFLGNGDIRLNPARISSDVEELEQTLDAGDERAIALYRGPFLDGFVLRGVPEFEHWAERHRRRLEERVVRLIEQLATRAAAANELKEAVSLWRRAAELRPLDSGIALGLMKALAATGDRAGATRHAALHATLLRTELDLPPDPAIVKLAESLREPAAEPATTGERAPVDAERVAEVAPTGSDASNPDVATGPRTDLSSPAEIAPRHSGLARWTLAAAAVVALIASGFALGRTRAGMAVFRPGVPRQHVVVAPFRVAGATATLGYLRDAMVELLATRLSDDSAARAIDAGAMLGAWRAAEVAPAMDVPRDRVVRVAEKFGAERVVVGGVVGTPSRVVIRATMLRVADGGVASQASVEGPADSLTALVDRLAARLLAVEAGEQDRIANTARPSLSALRSYLGGVRAFRDNDYTNAIRLYETALRRDSTFAPAALRLAVTADRIDDASRVRQALAVAWRHRDGLVARDRATLAAFIGDRYPAPPKRANRIDDWLKPAEITPTSVEAWTVAGSRLIHEGAAAGVDRWPERASSALQRALQLDSAYVPAARLLAELSVRDGRLDSLTGAARRAALDDETSPLAPFLRWRLAVAREGKTATRPRRVNLGELGPASLRAVAMASQFDVVALDDGARALRLLRNHAQPRPSPDLALAEHSLALNQGRVRAAQEATSRLVSAGADRPELRLRVLDAIYGDADSAAAREAAETLTAIQRASGDARRGSSRAADLCVIAQWELNIGNAAAAESLSRELRAEEFAPGAAVWASPRACVDLIDAAVAVATDRPDADARVAALDSLAFTVETAGDAAAYAPLWIARMHEALGENELALRALRRRPYMSDWPRYLAPMLREEGRLAETVGDIPAALEAYGAYLKLRQSPEPALRAEADEIRAAVVRLEARQ